MTHYTVEELSIEVSSRCLMRCIMCSSGSDQQEYYNELTSEEIYRLIKQARDLGATVLSLSGGDPILQSDMCILYINLAVKLGYKKVLFYTTGIRAISESGSSLVPHSGINPNWLDRLAKRGLIDNLVMIFSLHSHRPEVNDYIMGRSGAWNAIVDNIQLCRNFGIDVWVHMVPMLPNWQDAPNLRHLCGELGVSKMSMLRFVPQTRGYSNNDKLALDKRHFTLMQTMMNDMLEYDVEYSTDLRLGCPIDFRHTIDPKIRAKVKPCHAGTDLILVRPDGSVHPCAAWKTLPETDNIRSSSLHDIWNDGVVFKAIREYREGGWKRIQGSCASCQYQPSCKSGCPAQRMHALKIAGYRAKSCIDDLYIDAPDPLCPVGYIL